MAETHSKVIGRDPEDPTSGGIDYVACLYRPWVCLSIILNITSIAFKTMQLTKP